MHVQVVGVSKIKKLPSTATDISQLIDLSISHALFLVRAQRFALAMAMEMARSDSESSESGNLNVLLVVTGCMHGISSDRSTASTQHVIGSLSPCSSVR